MKICQHCCITDARKWLLMSVLWHFSASCHILDLTKYQSKHLAASQLVGLIESILSTHYFPIQEDFLMKLQLCSLQSLQVL